MRRIYQEETSLKLPVFALLTPIERLREVPALGWIVSVIASAIGTMISAVRGSMFLGAIALLMASALIDYYLGRKAAKASDTYRSEVAHAGALSKSSGILIVLLIRGLESWLIHIGLNTHGMVASAVALSLFGIDLTSIQEHRQALGARPIPVLSKLIALLHQLGERSLGSLLGVGVDEKR